ncbi:hypothetical protein MK805_01425 [Shimazuella sp. AN120528]|uniref:hypothetical protein n=1 Tax=Shimazuella soli TaxID=1892854 RepID=UPI001F10AC85|nr:hypothetical protein [Shimazuella soli]MCH5583632.1 hypothetical protein [Shimazuella soli]
MEPRDELVTDREWFHQLMGLLLQQLGQNKIYPAPDEELILKDFSISVQDDGFIIVASAVSKDGRNSVSKTLTYQEEGEKHGEAIIFCKVMLIGDSPQHKEKEVRIENKSNVNSETVYNLWQGIDHWQEDHSLEV